MLDQGPALARLARERATEPAIPEYLERLYWWAYLRPASIRIFDHPAMVQAILWGQYRRLSNTVLARIAPGESVLQLACVYGDLSERIARRVGPAGALDIVDVAPIQIANVRRKLAAYDQVLATIADAATPQTKHFDCVLSFFLLHELPDRLKREVVDAALSASIVDAPGPTGGGSGRAPRHCGRPESPR